MSLGMDMTVSDWTRRERYKQTGLVTLVILCAAIIAAVPRNERRMFTIPAQTAAAMGTITPPEQTLLRSPIFGPLFGWLPGHAAGAGYVGQPAQPQYAGLGGPEPTGSQPGIPGPSAFFAQPMGEPPETFGTTPITLPFGLPPIFGGPGLPPALPFGGPPPPIALGILPPVTVAAVPEPASWAMMIAGLGMIGGLMRRRRRTLRFV